MRNANQELNVNFQYLQYLKRIGLSEDRMSDTQRIETKRAFYAGFGQCLVSVRDDISDNEDRAVEELQNMHDQVKDFWEREVQDLVSPRTRN